MALRLVSIKDDVGDIGRAALREAAASKYVGLSINTFRLKVRQGEIVARGRGKQRIFLRWDLDAYLESLPRIDTKNSIQTGRQFANPKEGRTLA